LPPEKNCCLWMSRGRTSGSSTRYQRVGGKGNCQRLSRKQRKRFAGLSQRGIKLT
jgi:hypothetical protein